MTDERFDPETTHSIEAIAAEFTRIIESRNAALESARAELRSETLWAKQYHDEAVQLRAENARLREALNDGVEYAIDLQCEWDYKKHEPRNGNKASYEALVKFIADANAMYAGYPETNETPTA